MPRRPRLELAGGVHHVTSRGNNHHTIFPDEKAYRLFLRSFSAQVKRSRWICLDYCLIPNHFHLVIETPEPNLGHGMKRVLGPFVQTLHRLNGSDGPMFKGRFHSTLVDSDEYFARLIRYVALNPVNHGLCDDPADWAWSSHRIHMVGRPHDLVTVGRVDEYLSCWGGKPGTRYASLLAPAGPWGTRSDAATLEPPRPSLGELFGGLPTDKAMLAARWEHGYRVYEIAAHLGVSESAVSRATRRG